MKDCFHSSMIICFVIFRMLKIVTQGNCRVPWFLLDSVIVTDSLRRKTGRRVTLTWQVILKERYYKWATHKCVRKFLWNLMTERIELRLGSLPSAHKDPSNNCHLELVSGTRIRWECKFCCVRAMWVLKGRWTPRVWLNCASLLCVFVSGSRAVELQQQWISIDFQVSLGVSSVKWMLTKLAECHRASSA